VKQEELKERAEPVDERADRAQKEEGKTKRSMPPGIVSRIVAVCLAGALALALLDDLADRLAASPDPGLAAARAEEAGAARAEVDPAPPRSEADPTVPIAAEVALAVEPSKEPSSTAAPADAREPQTPPEEPVAPEHPAEPAADPETLPEEPARASVLERCRLVVESDERGEAERASREASQVVFDFGSPELLIAALVEEGLDEHQARLLTIRSLLLAGRDEQARDEARAAKLRHPDLSEVERSIQEWRLLRPRIVELDSFVNERQRLVLRGTVRNEDVGAVRRVRVRGELLDGDGNVVASGVTRVKPKLIASDLTGEFEIRFKEPADHESVTRTRASVIQYEYEVASAE
jgi:hypothetical protein